MQMNTFTFPEISQQFRIADKARSKLANCVNEFSINGHGDLRILVGHANLLDRLNDNIENIKLNLASSQTASYNSLSSVPEQQQQQHSSTNVLDTLEDNKDTFSSQTTPDSDSDSEPDSDSASDSDNNNIISSDEEEDQQQQLEYDSHRENNKDNNLYYSSESSDYESISDSDNEYDIDYDFKYENDETTNANIIGSLKNKSQSDFKIGSIAIHEENNTAVDEEQYDSDQDDNNNYKHSYGLSSSNILTKSMSHNNNYSIVSTPKKLNINIKPTQNNIKNKNNKTKNIISVSSTCKHIERIKTITCADLLRKQQHPKKNNNSGNNRNIIWPSLSKSNPNLSSLMTRSNEKKYKLDETNSTTSPTNWIPVQ
ncbi:Ecm13p NDAI_0J00580 [Naumovozyma dairenensis CBS 421]|uniref:Uncharacterized protein n=1 Tax=Naumovozyma dairenensis (strain ATCC 10597 / BCRC 20456 / CBS 421 / NBRC 0211 / NRRL Y-12639) TaxID=1071378 RepID=G0WGM2_NAUDC|nr:hypothetical protein NDAI_0J00580 [Naumovozyma dairenensis CBS 421]CCD26950.1 hypothetical protein NDAI_0J00580 [Naumovozyma dairenensis CBS 421]